MSESMTMKDSMGNPRFQTAVSIIPDLCEKTKRNTTVGAALRTTVIGFNQQVRILYPENNNTTVNKDQWYNSTDIDERKIDRMLQWFNSNNELKVENCTGQTYYTELFKSLKEIIRIDQKKLSPEQFDLYRPVVYFLTDGKPEGESETDKAIQEAYRILTEDSKERQCRAPAIFAIGIGDQVSKKMLDKYGAGRTKTVFKDRQPITESIPYTRANPSMAVHIAGNNFESRLFGVNKAVIKCIIDSLEGDRSDKSLPPGEIIPPGSFFEDPEEIITFNRRF